MTDTSAVVSARVPRQRSVVRPASEVDEASRLSLRGLVFRALPWVVVVAALVAALVWTGTPKTAILRYGAYWVGGVVVPGTLVYRALRGSRGNLPEDVGFGAVTGFALQLIGWALFVGTGLGGWLRIWPVLVIVPFVAVPRLRRYWSLRSAEPMRLAASWAIAGVMLVAVATIALASWAINPVLPATHTLFGDIYYHWANAAELRRTITPQQPQMAGNPLVYHWFSDAYRGSASMLSGVPLNLVMLRLWMVPVVLTATLVIAGLARQVSGVWWSGPVAAVIAAVISSTSFWPAYTYGAFAIGYWGSPTLVFSIPVQAAVVSLLVDIARGVRLGRAWVLFAVLLPVATASKSSSLPDLIAGIGLAALVSWVINRRPPWTLIASGAAGLLVLAATATTLAGGEAGAGIQVGAGFTFKPEFFWLADGPHVAGTGGFWPAAWLHMSWRTRPVLLVLTLCLLISQIGRVDGVAILLRRPIRRDLAAWLLAGVVVAGWGAGLLINHVANGEMYFMFSAIPAGSALTAWLLAVVAPASRRALTVVGGVVLGWAAGALLQRFGPGDHLPAGVSPSTVNPGGGGQAHWVAHWRADLLGPVAALAGVLAAGALIWWLARLRWPGVLAGAGVAVLVAGGVVGLGVDTTYRGLAAPATNALHGKLPTHGRKGSFYVTEKEMRAAQWLARHAPTGDVVATNVHCENVVTTAYCTSRSFWVSALSEHAIVLEGWAYQPAVMAEHGHNGLPYFQQPAPDQARLRVNDAAFTDATPAALAELRDKYHAKWLFADTRAGYVSPELARLAIERYRSGTAIVYELPA